MSVKIIKLLVPEKGASRKHIQECRQDWTRYKDYYKDGFEKGAFDILNLTEQGNQSVIYTALKQLLGEKFNIPPDEDGEFPVSEGSYVEYIPDEIFPEASFHYYHQYKKVDLFFKEVDHFITIVHNIRRSIK